MNIASPRTVARVNHPNNTSMYGKDMGADVAISQAHIMSHLIQAEVGVGELIPLLALQYGELALVEETIATTSAFVGRTVGTLELPSGAVPVPLVRCKRVLVPTADVVLEAGERLVALARADQELAVSAALRETADQAAGQKGALHPGSVACHPRGVE